MTIEELVKLCKEYEHITLDIKTIEKNIDKYIDCEWGRIRDCKKLLKKQGRKCEIEELFIKIGVKY